MGVRSMVRDKRRGKEKLKQQGLGERSRHNECDVGKTLIYRLVAGKVGCVSTYSGETVL